MSRITGICVLWLRGVAAALLASVLATACGGGSVGPEATRAPVTESGRISSATIGSGGGRVTATASSGVTYTLEIPAGALSAPVRISLTPIIDMGSAPLARQTFGAVLLEPSGLALSIPATLRIGATPTLTGGRKLVGFSSANDGSKFAINLARVDGSSALVNVTHFSIGGGAAATPADLLPLAPLVPTLADADDAIAQLSALTVRDAGLVQIVDVFRQWYVEIVKPALNQADGSNDIVFGINAIAEYGIWINTMDFVADRASLDIALADELNEAKPIATRVFTAFINGRLNECSVASPSTESRLATLGLASFIQEIAQNRGLAGTGSGLDRPTFLLRANNCLRPVLDPITLPTPLTIGTGKSIDAHAQIIFNGATNPQGAPFAFTLTATGASLASPVGFSDAQGNYTSVFTPSDSTVEITVRACLVLPDGSPAGVTSDICVSQKTGQGGGSLRKSLSWTHSFFNVVLITPFDPLIFSDRKTQMIDRCCSSSLGQVDVTVSVDSNTDTVTAAAGGGVLGGSTSCTNGGDSTLHQRIGFTFANAATLSYSGQFQVTGTADAGTSPLSLPRSSVRIQVFDLSSTSGPITLADEVSSTTGGERVMPPLSRLVALEPGTYQMLIRTTAACSRRTSDGRFVTDNLGVSRVTTSAVDIAFPGARLAER